MSQQTRGAFPLKKELFDVRWLVESAVEAVQPLLVAELQRSAAAGSQPVTSHPSLRVLIADDNKDAADSLAMYLRMAGHQVTVVHTGADALQSVGQIRPHAVLLDIGMPDMNGYEVAERIRGQKADHAITLIALTGWGQESDKRRAQAAGFDHHLTKPADPEAIDRIIAGLPVSTTS